MPLPGRCLPAIIIACLSLAPFPCPSPAAEREPNAVLAWIESVGGRTLLDESGEAIGVELEQSWLIDSDLARLTLLPRLQRINLSYTKITDVGLEQLAPLQHVRHLDLYYAESVTDLGIAHLKHWQQLEYLNVRGTKVTSSLFETVSQLRRLKFLDIGHSRVNDDLFEQLTSLEQLEHLSFGGNKMSGTTLPLLKLLPSLHSLSVSGQQRTDSGLWSVAVTDFNIDHIAALERLRTLDLGGTGVTDRGIAKLARLRQLDTLDLRGTRVTGKGIAALTDLPRLRHLKLGQAAGIDDAAVPSLARMSQLEIIELPETSVTFDGLKQLAALPQLRQLLAGGVSLSPTQAESLRQAMPQCLVSWWAKPEIATPVRGRRGRM